MTGLNRKLAPSELNDAFRLIAIAEGIGADSLDDLESLGRMRGVSQIAVRGRDWLDEMSGIIKARAQRRFDLGGQSGEPGEDAE